MWKCIASATSLWLVASGPVLAQQPAAKPDSPEAKAAMERAQRMADNPMRVILQAGKIKRRAEDNVPEPVADPAVRRTAVRTAADAPAAAPTNRPVTAAPAIATSAPATVAAASVATAPAAPPAEPQPSKVMSSPLLSAPGSTSVPALEIAQPVEAAPVTTKAVAPQAIPIPPANVRPTLVSMVEPEIPARLQLEAGRVNQVLADLTLREDGTVASATLVSPVPRSWQRIIVTALEKWRFEPLPGGRVHRVQLVFGE